MELIDLTRLIGLAVLILGLTFSLNPKAQKRMLSYFKQENRIYFMAVLRILVGLIFMFSSPQARLSVIVFLLGLITVLSGAGIFYLGPKRVIEFVDIVEEKPQSSRRMLGLVPIIMGVLVLYSA